MEKIEILRILDAYSNEDEATKQRIANALLDLSNVVGQSEQLSFTDGTMPSMGSKEFNCYHGLCECKQNCKQNCKT